MQFITETGSVEVEIEALTIAGWTGRDSAVVQHHIDELAAIGVAPPSEVPLFYRVSRELLTQASKIEMLGSGSSGEAEPMIVNIDGQIWLGLGSDHTDRDLEAHSVAASKQICAKPCAESLWNFNDVQDHLDVITVQSWIYEADDWILYQDGTLGQIIALDSLLEQAPLGPQSAMMCGTFGAIGGVRPAAKFRARMHDPVRNTQIELAYTARNLPVIS